MAATRIPPDDGEKSRMAGVEGTTALVALGSNLPGRHGTPLAVCAAAVAALNRGGLRVVRQSGWYRTAPVPASDQPWYANGVVLVASDLGPAALLAALHGIEADFGRVRLARNQARVLDLDLLAVGSLIHTGPAAPILPHPRLAERAFVLKPLAEIAPDWVHPVSGIGIDDLIAALPPGQTALPLS